MPSEPEDDGMELVEKFVVVTSVGGPYEDEAFVAGIHYGCIQTLMEMYESGIKHYGMVPDTNPYTVPVALLPQLDLLAMRKGWTMEVIPETDYYATVKFTYVPRET